MPIPVIDLFAGPGGLNEGFSCLRDTRGNRVFGSALSIECDESAHRTLVLRALFRRLRDEGNIKPYRRYVRQEIDRDALFAITGAAGAASRSEALRARLGNSDIEDLQIEEKIAEALGAPNSADFVLIGGPPCQAYSIVGRVRNNKVAREEFEKDEKHYLYREYLRIVRRFRPIIFLMENVPGLLSATLSGNRVFEHICRDLRKVGYTLHSLNPDAKPGEESTDPWHFVLKADEFGVPQVRHRVFILGVRSDLNLKPLALGRPLENAYATVGGVLDDLPRIRSRLSREEDSGERWRDAILGLNKYEFNHLDPKFRESLRARLETVHSNYSPGGQFMERVDSGPSSLTKWFIERDCNFVLNHNSRAHMRKDLMRYFFWSQYAAFYGKSPRMDDVPYFLRPNHMNLRVGDPDAGADYPHAIDTPFNDRFRVQIRARPSTTIVSHIAKDGHYYIHYEPRQCRSLSVREAARLQTFPDSYFFEGAITEQYQQVGNAVPPYLATQIAAVVELILHGAAASTHQAPIRPFFLRTG